MMLLIMTVKNWTPPSKIEIKNILDSYSLSTKKAAHMARIGDKTFKEWLDSENPKLPSQAAWSMFTYELRSMKMGYKNIDHFFEAIESQYER